MKISEFKLALLRLKLVLCHTLSVANGFAKWILLFVFSFSFSLFFKNSFIHWLFTLKDFQRKVEISSFSKENIKALKERLLKQ